MARSGRSSIPSRCVGCLGIALVAACLWHYLPDILAAIVARQRRGR